jgi:hypothetical protein
MAAWAGLISVRWRKVPAGPVKLPTWIRSSWRRSSGQTISSGDSYGLYSRLMAVHDGHRLVVGGLGMREPEEFEGALGLADFLSDLRAELAEASKRAEGDSLKLGVEEVTVSLDVAVTIAKKGGVSAKASAKFWVFASAEGSVQGELSSQRVSTQHLTLTLKPRTEEVVTNQEGKPQTIRHDLDVTGPIAKGEEWPGLPAPEPGGE